ncbi:uncharacterized protein [Gossypium hirsutum]|uniref:Tf2-1-like SH3-like domain-containing protein n=1 Tax=Gossypium hirsutum TaxID=3635 RepID=A0ABM3BH44_GOSHI|nr:uncharacterized protein LOC121226788 [Gossypium hirsutum]
MDFVSGLPLTPAKKDSVWVIVDRLTKSTHFIPIRMVYSMQKLAKLCRTLCWTELSECWILGPELVSKTESIMKVIHDSLKATSDRQKSYDDLKRKDIEFSLGYQVLKVSPWKKVLQFGRKGKLILRFIRPHRILKCVRPDTYQLELPQELERIHDVFHVLMLRRYQFDPSQIFPANEIELQLDLTFEDEPIQIIDCDVKVLMKKSVPLVKVLWQNHETEEATWEPEDLIWQQYPYLFELCKFQG